MFIYDSEKLKRTLLALERSKNILPISGENVTNSRKLLDSDVSVRLRCQCDKVRHSLPVSGDKVTDTCLL